MRAVAEMRPMALWATAAAAALATNAVRTMAAATAEARVMAAKIAW